MEGESIVSYISFIDKNDKCVYVDKNLIIDKFPVLSGILRLKKEFNDVPEKDSKGNYLFFNNLDIKSIICIFKYLETNFEKEIEKNEFLIFLKNIDKDIFIEAVNECEPLSLFIPENLYKLAHKPPMNKTEDIYNEYQFFEFYIDFTSSGIDKEIYHKIFNNYLTNGWIIVEQIEKPHNKSTIILRKKI